MLTRKESLGKAKKKQLEKQLVEQTKMVADMQRGHRPDLPFLTQNEFILKYAQFYDYHELPDCYEKMTPNQCYHNASKMAMKHKNLVYVEGIAIIPTAPIPIAHAWCVERGSNKVLELTADSLRIYYGVSFKTSYVRQNYMEGRVGLIDHWEKDWPLLRMSEEEVRKVLDDHAIKA